MAKVKYDVSDVETGGGAELQPNLYRGEIVNINHRSQKRDNTAISDLEVAVDFGRGYARKFTYIKLPDDPQWDKTSHGWKLREFLDAVGLGPSGTIDTAPAALKKLYKPVNARIVADTNQDGTEYRGKIKNLLAPTGDVSAPPPVETEGDSGATPSGGGGDEGPYPREEIETWPDDDIKTYAEELGVEVATGRGARSKTIDAIIVAQDSSDASEPEPEPEADGNLDGIAQEYLDELKSDASEYDDWTDDDIKWLIEGLGIGGNVPTSGRGWKQKAIAAFVEFASNGASAGSEQEPDTFDDENEWPTEELKNEINNRNEQGAGIEIAGRWTRQKMIDALREDDKAADPF